MRSFHSWDQPSRKFKLKNTARYERKLFVRGGHPAAEGGLAGGPTPCDVFLEYCLKKS
jgi:hypothetical protein